MCRVLSWIALLLLLASTACALDVEGRANVIPRPDGGYGSTSGDGGDTDAGSNDTWGLTEQSATGALAEAAGGAAGATGASY